MSGFILLAAGLITSRLALAYGSSPQPNYPHKFIITFQKENLHASTSVRHKDPHLPEL